VSSDVDWCSASATAMNGDVFECFRTLDIEWFLNIARSKRVRWSCCLNDSWTSREASEFAGVAAQAVLSLVHWRTRAGYLEHGSCITASRATVCSSFQLLPFLGMIHNRTTRYSFLWSSVQRTMRLWRKPHYPLSRVAEKWRGCK